MLNIAFGILLGFFITACVASGYNPLSFKKDATDGEKRSGLVIYTDYGTGVQYVANLMGGMSVRVDKDGKPMLILQQKGDTLRPE